MIHRLAIFLFAALLPAGLLRAEDSAIRVTTTLHPDGSRTDREVNPDERTATETTFDAAGKKTQKVTYKLDESGNATEGIAYDADDRPLMKLKFFVDPATGRVTERQEFTPAGKPIRKLVYRYDAATGKLKGIDAYDPDGKPLGKR